MGTNQSNPTALMAGLIVLVALAFLVSMSFAFKGSVHF